MTGSGDHLYARAMKMARLALLASLCAPLLLAACGTSRRESGLAHVGPAGPAEQTCRRDADCTIVEDCCGCFHGGSRTAVRTDAVESLQAASEGACAERSCAENVESNHRSCQATEAVCRGGRCIPSL